MSEAGGTVGFRKGGGGPSAPESITRPTLLIDGNNLAMRALSVGLRGLTARDGTNTGHLVVMANMLSRYVRAYDPRAVVVCWDGGRSAYRTEILETYKHSRAERPEHHDAFALMSQFVALSGMHQETWPGYEADDLIAGYWRLLNGDVAVLSSDKDLMQLVGRTPNGGRCVQVRPGTLPEEWDSDAVVARLGCLPEHYPLVLALAGDRSDDVDGIPGVGIKTANKVLAAAGWSLERLMADQDQRYWLYAEQVERNRKLTDLRTYGPPNLSRLVEPTPFVPVAPETEAGARMAEFLSRYALSDLGRRFAGGSLWRDDSE